MWKDPKSPNSEIDKLDHFISNLTCTTIHFWILRFGNLGPYIISAYPKFLCKLSGFITIKSQKLVIVKTHECSLAQVWKQALGYPCTWLHPCRWWRRRPAWPPGPGPDEWAGSWPLGRFRPEWLRSTKPGSPWTSCLPSCLGFHRRSWIPHSENPGWKFFNVA